MRLPKPLGGSMEEALQMSPKEVFLESRVSASMKDLTGHVMDDILRQTPDGYKLANQRVFPVDPFDPDSDIRVVAVFRRIDI